MGQSSFVRSANRDVATIPNGTAVSNAIKMHDTTLGGLVLPAAWTAADLTFESSLDGVTWAQVWDDANAEVLIAAATIAARLGDVLVPSAAILAKLAGLHLIRLVSGNTAANVNQLAARTITVLLKS